MTADTPLPVEQVSIRRDVFDFLMGTGALGGYYFGDSRPDMKGRFWWRSVIREGLAGQHPLPSGDVEGLVERLRIVTAGTLDTFAGLTSNNAMPTLQGLTSQSRLLARDVREAADALASLSVECERLREALEWYGEQARLARLIHSEGEAGRAALAADGGNRARTTLQGKRDG